MLPVHSGREQLVGGNIRVTRAASSGPTALRRERRAREVTLLDLALRLGISESALSRFETHGKPLPRELTPADYERALDELAPAGVA